MTGYAHIAWAPEWYRKNPRNPHATWDSTLNVIQGRLDFFEVLQFRLLGLEDYYDFLSMGIKLTASAGSDMPWASTLGESRVYVHTGRPFTADGWFRAFKQGRTFVTNGPMLSLTANGAGPGEDVNVRANGDGPHSGARVGAAGHRLSEDARSRLAGRGDPFRDLVEPGPRAAAARIRRAGAAEPMDCGEGHHPQ